RKWGRRAGAERAGPSAFRRGPRVHGSLRLGRRRGPRRRGRWCGRRGPRRGGPWRGPRCTRGGPGGPRRGGARSRGGIERLDDGRLELVGLLLGGLLDLLGGRDRDGGGALLLLPHLLELGLDLAGLLLELGLPLLRIVRELEL